MAVGEADGRGRLVGELTEGGPLVGGDPRRRPARVAVAHPVQSLAVEGMQVGLDGVRVKGAETSDGSGVPALGVEHDGLGAAQLPAVGSRPKELTQLPEFGGGGPAGGHGAGHGGTSPGEGQPAIVPKVVCHILTDVR